ncbi:MAG: RluA family pseudouridine synthase [Bacteroidota bacterium]
MEILYEDNHLISIVKPFCIPSQGDNTGDKSIFDLVKAYIRTKYAKPGNVYVGLLHRLDRPVGGVMLLAKTSKAAARMSKQFQDREVQKIYCAVTERIPTTANGELHHHLRKIGGKNIMRAFSKPVAHSKEAKLSYSVLQTAGSRALVEIYPQTGRRHQIRVQLANIGCVIVGDVKYGKTSFNPDKSICLFAKSLRFIHPVQKKEIFLSAKLPLSGPWKDFRS